MRLPSVVCIAVLLGLLSSSTAARAEERTNVEPRREVVSFAAWMEHGEFIGEDQIRRLYLSVGSNQCGFIVPSGLRVDVSRADRVTLSAPDLSYFLMIRIRGNSAGVMDGFRKQALQDYPGALLTEESSAEAAGRSGPMFNLRWKQAEGVDRAVTVAFIPNAAGVLEFSVVAEKGKSSEAQSTLVGLLQRLQSAERGRLKMETFRQPDYN